MSKLFRKLKKGLEEALVLRQVSNAGLDLRENSRGCKFVSGSVLNQYKPTYELATPGFWRGPTLHFKLDGALAHSEGKITLKSEVIEIPD